MTILTVTHKTTYHYANPVEFGEHRLMVRPRDSHDLQLLETSIAITPTASIRWLHDVFGNSIALATFGGPASQLYVRSTVRAEHYPTPPQDLTLEPYAASYPFGYSVEDIPDLGRTTERHYPDPGHSIDQWARGFVTGRQDNDTLGILIAVAQAIKRDFSYSRREEMGIQPPAETLQTRTGSCRDFALLMMEAVRSLGFAARFVSGYLYDEALIGARASMVGGGETHAWVQIYLPGAGWVEFDPTNALVGGRNLIRVAVARDPSQAVPLAGSFTGAAGDFLNMEVEVTVTAEAG